jgi:tRNA(Ile)-lysidine synthase
MAGALLAARSDAQPEVRWSGATIRRRADRLELHVTPEVRERAPAQSRPKSWRWRTQREHLVNGGVLALVDDPAGPIDLARLPAMLALRPRAGGETLRPGPRARTQSLKKLLQSAGFTIEQRAALPLLFAGEQLVAVGDRWIDARIAANDKSRRRARLVWREACPRLLKNGE